MKRTLLALLLLASPAAADEVILKSGARFEGRVVAAGDRTITLQLDCGTMSFNRVDVARVVLKPSSLDEFDEKIRAMAPGDVDARRQLAAWAEGRGLDTRARALHEDIVRLAPDDAASRTALGHVKHEGTWMSEVQAREARGEVFLDGRWMKRQEADTLKQLRAELARRAQDLARLEAEIDGIQARLEKELAAADDVRRRLEREECWSRTTLLVAPPQANRWVILPGGTVVYGDSPVPPKPPKGPPPPPPPAPPVKK